MFQTVSDAVPTTCVNLVRLCFVALVSQHPADNMTDWADRTGWCSSDFICALAASAGSKKAKRAQCPADQLACSVGDGYEVSDRSRSARRRVELNLSIVSTVHRRSNEFGTMRRLCFRRRRSRLYRYLRCRECHLPTRSMCRRSVSLSFLLDLTYFS